MAEPTTMEEWLASRPESVRKLLAEFPMGTEIMIDDRPWWVIGATEDDILVISPVAPSDNTAIYNEMMRRRKRICADHLRDKSVVAIRA
jgi:hypothetical protein